MQDDPFSDKASELPDGSYMPRHTNRMLAEHYHVRNGKLWGSYEAYFDNGNPSVKTFFNENGHLDGEYLVYDQDKKGRVLEEKFYKDGKRDGLMDQHRTLTLFKDNKPDFTRTALLRYVILPGVKLQDFVEIVLLGTRQEKPDAEKQIARAKQIARRL